MDQATEELTALVNKYPKDPDIWLELSYAARTFGRGDPTTYASVAHRLAPEDARTNRELALALAHDADRLDEAVEVMEQLIERDETDALSWAILGAVRLAAGQPGLAEVAGKRALSADPHCVEAKMVLGDTALTFGRLDEAGHWYERVLRVEPENVQATAALSWIEQRTASNDGSDLSTFDAVAAVMSASAPDGTVDDPVDDTPPTAHDERSPHDARTAYDVGPNRAEIAVDEHPSPSSDDAPGTHARDDAPQGAARFAGQSDDEAETTPKPFANEAEASRRDSVRRNDEPSHGGRAEIEALNRQVLEAIEAHIDAYNRRDIDALVDGFSEDAVLRTAHEGVVGRRELHQLFTDAFESAEPTELLLRSAVVQNGTAACELTERVYDDGDVYESEFFGLYTVLAGRIVRARLYRDDG